MLNSSRNTTKKISQLLNKWLKKREQDRFLLSLTLKKWTLKERPSSFSSLKFNNLLTIGLFISSIFLLNSCSYYRSFRNRGEITSPKNLKEERTATEFKLTFFEANKQKMLGNYKTAATLFEHCLKINPQSGAANYELAGILTRNKNFPQAITYAKKAAEIDSKNYWYQSLLAALYFNSGKPELGNNILEQLLKDFPERKNIYLELANNYLKSNQIEKAIRILELFEKDHGINAQIIKQKANIYLSQKAFKKARLEIQKLIKDEPNNLQNYLFLGDIYMDEGQAELALEQYQKVQKKNPQYGMVYFSLSQYYDYKKDEKTSFEYLKKWFQSEDTDRDLKLKLISTYLSINKLSDKDRKKVDELLQIASNKYPNNLMVHALQADFLIQSQQLLEAEKHLLAIVEVEKNKKEIWEQILYIDNQLSQFDSLLIHAQAMLEYFPNQSEAYFFGALGAYYTQKYSKSVEFVEDGIDFVQKDSVLKSQFYTVMGDAQHKLHQHNKSDQAYELALSFNPKNYYVCNNYAYYLSTRDKNLDKALELSQVCIDNNINSSTYLDTYAWILFKQKRYQEALTFIQKAYEASGGKKSPAIIEHMGDILYHIDKKEEALEKWKEAQSLGKGSSSLEQKIKDKKYTK